MPDRKEARPIGGGKHHGISWSSTTTRVPCSSTSPPLLPSRREASLRWVPSCTSSMWPRLTYHGQGGQTEAEIDGGVVVLVQPGHQASKAEREEGNINGLPFPRDDSITSGQLHAGQPFKPWRHGCSLAQPTYLSQATSPSSWCSHPMMAWTKQPVWQANSWFLRRGPICFLGV